jgi:nicotinic acid mononucleotide adenylyltransferase
MKIYISGPMTGLPELNKPAFLAAEAALKDKGYEVLNPVKNGLPDTAPWEDHMRADIIMLMGADGVALLDGWGKSRGALKEVAAALHIMPVYILEKWLEERAWSA